MSTVPRIPEPTGFRPPAVPLVTCDPYFSIWSCHDRLTDGPTRHWTGTPQALSGLVRIDGRCHRVMGEQPKDVPALPQRSLQVHPLRTIYTFEGEGIRLDLTFTAPLLPHDLEALSRPLTYVAWTVRAIDGGTHDVAVYFDAPGALAVNSLDQKVQWARVRVGDLRVLRIGTQDQRVLDRAGDNLRIDWGHLYVAAPGGPGVSEAIAPQGRAQDGFRRTGTLPDADALDMPRPAHHRDALAFAFDLGTIGAEPAQRHVILAYDDGFSVEYLQRRLRPYWRRHGAGAAELLLAAERDYAELSRRCTDFDEALARDLAAAGGEPYARLCALAFRQSLAAQKLCADADGAPVSFSKENFSNGCIATVDVLYPASPLMLLFNPALLAASLRPILDYARLPRWRFPFAPHDLGTYPLANGQVYGGGERSEQNQMPVEECGNMLLLAAALADTEGGMAFLAPYRDLLDRWADYLLDRGFDPENQLCTDDFAGHLAHNANLSVKAILALAAHARVCARAGAEQKAARYAVAAREFAGRWVQAAEDGDHYRLAFDAPGTWSQKYNLVWDRVLGLGVFPAEVARREIASYRARLGPFGLPLDNRADWAKVDWTVWTATLAESDRDFHALVDPLHAFVQASESRVPLTDWYRTTDAKQVGFQARSVVGGVFIRMLTEPGMAEKWRSWGA